MFSGSTETFILREDICPQVLELGAHPSPWVGGKPAWPASRCRCRELCLRVSDFHPSAVLLSGNHRVLLLQGKPIINSCTWGTSVWCASVHTAFFKENVEPLALHGTESLGELSACLLPEKEPTMSFILSKSFDVNSHLAGTDSFY